MSTNTIVDVNEYNMPQKRKTRHYSQDWRHFAFSAIKTDEKVYFSGVRLLTNTELIALLFDSMADEKYIAVQFKLYGRPLICMSCWIRFFSSMYAQSTWSVCETIQQFAK